MDGGAGVLVGGVPDEGDVEVKGEVADVVALAAVGFAELALDVVAVDGVAEMALGDGDHDAVGGMVVGPVHGADGVTGDGVGGVALEELVDGRAPGEALGFGEAVRLWHCFVLVCMRRGRR